MNNYAIARVFTGIADLMEIKGENLYKIRAYRNAASTMRELTESLEDLAARDALQTIPNVGEAIADKTREIIATGTTKLYERLRSEVPESLTELLDLPGFGTKKIETVWKKLGVTNLDELETATREGRLRGLPGFAEKTEAKLLEAIAAHRRRRQRAPIFTVYPYAEALAAMMRETGAFQRVEVAGSARRMLETIADVNLVGQAEDVPAALDAFAKHPEVEEVVSRGAREVCVMSRTGVRADIRLAPAERFGAWWQKFTGSWDHNAVLEALAKLRGVPVTEDGLIDVPGDEESAVYSALGVPWIVPELREGRGEVEAAIEGRLPKLIDIRDIRGVLHAHSTWSDGVASIERMVHAAREYGYEYHACTDHSKALAMTQGLNEERLQEQIAEIDALNATFTDGFRILKGIECDILPDGELDLPCEVLEQLDIVIASVHSNQRQDQETMTRRIVRALDSGVVALLAHPTGRRLGARDPYAVDMARVMDAAVANKVAMEINSTDRLDMSDIYARQAKERGIPISINTDSHRPGTLAPEQYRYGIAQARRAWLEPGDVINTWPLEKLLGWLQRRER